MNKILLLVLVLNFSCETNDVMKIETNLKHEMKDDSHLLVMTVINKSPYSIYIPRLSSLMESEFDSLRIINLNGKIKNKEFINNEILYNASKYGPPVGGKNITDYCSDFQYDIEEIDFDLSPFMERKALLKSIVQNEYRSLVTAHSLKNPTEKDIANIKSLIFSKYKDAIFLQPYESFKDCITINTLFLGDDPYKIIVHKTPTKEVERYTYNFDNGIDSIEINSILLEEFEGYKLFNETIYSDTLVVNL